MSLYERPLADFYSNCTIQKWIQNFGVKSTRMHVTNYKFYFTTTFTLNVQNIVYFTVIHQPAYYSRHVE